MNQAAQATYEAFYKSRYGSMLGKGIPIPSWATLAEDIKEAWCEAADAAIASRTFSAQEDTMTVVRSEILVGDAIVNINFDRTVLAKKEEEFKAAIAAAIRTEWLQRRKV